MSRTLRLAALLLFLCGAGCTKDEDYLEVYRAQRENYRELTDILATIQDEKSMTDAKSKLDERAKKFNEIARKASALPKPPPESVRNRMADDAFTMERTLDRLRQQIKRVREDIKGGDEFLKQFESTSPGLLSAVKK